MLQNTRPAIIALLAFASVAAAAYDARLSTAAMNRDVATVRTLLDEKVDINAPQGDGTTALHWAAYNDDLELAKLLLLAGANPNVKTRLGGITPLHMAAKNGSTAMIDVLLKAGADLRISTGTGTTALMNASASGHADAVRLLLDAGADPNAKDINQGQTALMFGSALDRAEVVRLLAARGADVNVTSLVPDPYVMRKDAPATESTKPRGNNALALGGMTALQFAAREGQMAAVRELVAAGADVNIPTASDKMTTLTIAILNGHFDIAKFLLDHGSDAKPANTTGLTALFALIDAKWAAHVWYPAPNVEEERTNYLDLMKDLLDHGADPNARLGTKLWERQFHPDWVDPAGATAFWRAAQANDVSALKVLVAAGANPSIPTTHGCSPLEVAAGYGFEPQISTFIPDARLATVRYLIEELGADVNSKDDKGYTPLHGAALTAENNVILYLVSMGGDVKARASQVFASGDGPGDSVATGTGDSIADMANGPRPHNLVHPETVALLEKLGSPNSDNCRASTCVIKGKPDKTKEGKKQ
jgi:ankyrin repeat protein